MTRQVLHRKARRDRGMCAREGCPVQTGPAAYYCEGHRKAHADRMRRNRLANGVKPRKRPQRRRRRQAEARA